MPQPVRRWLYTMPSDDEPLTGHLAALVMYNDMTEACPTPEWIDDRALAERSFDVANAALRKLGFAPQLGTMTKTEPTIEPAETESDWEPNPRMVAHFAEVAMHRGNGNRHAAIEHARAQQSAAMFRELTFGDAVIDYLGRGEHKHSPTEPSTPTPPRLA